MEHSIQYKKYGTVYAFRPSSALLSFVENTLILLFVFALHCLLRVCFF